MTNKEKRDKFLKDFEEKYNGFQIIKFTKISEPIYFKDNNGILHYKKVAFRVLSHNVRMDSIVDKLTYVKLKLKKVFPKLKILSYKGMKDKIIVEDVNGFKYTPVCYDLLKGHPVSIQTCTEKEKLLIYKMNKVHKNFYSYLPFIYKDGKHKIKIKCPIHGEFNQMIERHLYGNGCKLCGGQGFTKKSWLKRLKNKKATFYILEMSNTTEVFIKVGITSLNVKLRYKNLKDYDYKIIDIIHGNPSDIFDLEKEIIKKFKVDKYIPKKLFQGYTECFTIEIKNKYEQFKKEYSERS